MNAVDKLKLRLRYQLYAKLKANFYPSFYSSHAQFGEDMVVRFLTEHIAKGFYVDIGAHHPVAYSNTYHFYCKGWTGVNIDATPGSMQAFNVLRPRDINLELCLSSTEEAEVDFYVFDRGAYNTFDVGMAEQILATENVRLLEKRKLPTQTLTQCLNSYLPPGTKINLMSIDVEGLDEAILRSNDWERYRPDVLIFEKHDVALKDLSELPLMKHLSQYGYEFKAKCGPSLILESREL